MDARCRCFRVIADKARSARDTRRPAGYARRAAVYRSRILLVVTVDRLS
ncbi:hypothetical protein Pta02_36470 [Planobispora takensis]|uniref:Uncharacterized protein n=1 Tax=Planobispora takensis TaxID=1367882 RepID=A0A8J3T617_9ACTN|nr:hypothetical protein Pta02_36470 [Planobispora takensis]